MSVTLHLAHLAAVSLRLACSGVGWAGGPVFGLEGVGATPHTGRAQAGRAGGTGGGERSQRAAPGTLARGQQGQRPQQESWAFRGPHSDLGTGVWLLFQNTGCEADSLLSKQSSVSGRRAFMFQPPFGATIPKLWVGRGSGNCTSWAPGLV